MNYQNNEYHGYVLGSLPEAPIEELERLSYQVASDGIVLLKNENNVLPFKKGDTVSLFGRAQREYYKSGTGSGGLVNVKYVTDIASSLKKSKDVAVNEELCALYDEWLLKHPFDKGQGWAGEPWCQEEFVVPMADVKKAREKSEIALIVLGRTAGEDKDNSATPGSYYLTEQEENLLSAVSSVFEKTVVVLNVGAIIDMNFVSKYQIKSVLYCWQGGMCGGEACADILLGKNTPCGKLADTIPCDIKDVPANQNFGDAERNFYKEDIFVGYRYFETFAKDKVAYPFGFGLSYTDFSLSDSAQIKDGRFQIDVIVQNVGTADGKEAVQVYFSAPNGSLGKASRELIAYEKTKLLKPNETQTLSLSFAIEQMCAYDESGVTGRKNCYVMEKGVYEIYLGTDVRSAKKIGEYEQKECQVVRQCEEVLTPVLPFDKMVNRDGKIGWEPVATRTYDEEKRIAQRMPKEIAYTGNRALTLKDVKDGKATVEDLIGQMTNEDLCALCRGEGMNSPKVTAGTGSCFGGLTPELLSFGLPIACCTDGPSGIRMDSGYLATSMPNGACIACTFDKELVKELYRLEGVEMTAYKIDVILGPGINIHRTPLNGRNFEYFSEDPYLTGTMASAISQGLNEVGVCCAVKHFMANSQEFHRHDCDSVISERAIREIYAKPFEIAVKTGNVKAIMTSYNLVNGNHSASSYGLNTTLLRDEWGYRGFVMTDWWAKMTNEKGEHSQKDTASMVKAQNDIYMVVENAKTHEDNLVQSLNEKKIRRAQLTTCAENLISYLINTHAYERFAQNGYTYEEQNLDTSSLQMVKSLENVAVKTPVSLKLDKSGKYVLEMEFSAEDDELAQIAVRVNRDNCGACSLVSHGTNGKRATVKTSLSLMAGEFTLTFLSSSERFTIHRINLYQ